MSRLIDADALVDTLADQIKTNESDTQPEQPSEIQDILDYLDTVLHPIISPEHWNVYSELHDMISTLPTAQPTQTNTPNTLETLDCVNRQAAIAKDTNVPSTDCISRQQAIDALDGEITVTGRANAEAVRGYANLVCDRIKRLPSAQPEIIHCGDCKYQDENWRRVSVRWLPCMEVRTGSNWYCGSAERRTDEE